MEKKRLLRLPVWFILFLIVGSYLYYIHLYAVNIPISDDYDLIRVKYTLLTQEYSWLKTLQFLIEPENDHRILIPRTIALLDYAVEGFINYRTLIWIVNGSLLGILGIWLVSFLRKGLNIWFFIPVLLWYLNPFVFDVTLWGINGMQHTTLNLLIFASLYLLATTPRLFTLALLLAFAATFTNGNGFLVFPAGLVLLLLASERKKAIGWSIGMVVALLAYFLNYSVGQATKVTVSGQFIQNLLVSFAALSGGWVAAFKGNSYVWLLWGAFTAGFITLVGVTLWLIGQTLLASAKPRPSHAYFWTGVFLFSVMTIGIIAVSRGGRDVYSVFTSRYSLYPLHLLTLSYLALLTWKAIPQPWVFRVALGFGIVFAAMSFYQYLPDIDTRRRSLVADHYNWRQHRKLMTHFRSELADFFTQPAYDKGIYRFTDFPLENAEAIISAPADTKASQKTDLKLSTRIKDIDFFNHPQKIAQFTLENTGWAQPGFGKEGVFLVLKSLKNTTYLLPTWPVQGGKRQFFTSGKVYKKGFAVTLYNENFVPDTYQIGLLSPQDKGYALHYLSQSVQIDSLNAQLVNHP
ncbi:MAG: hypothetical protein U0X91_13015 [Spirosomataceae bacterium]